MKIILECYWYVLLILSVSHINSLCLLHTNSVKRVWEREAHINWSMVIPDKAAPVTGTTLRTTGPVPAGSR